MNTPFFRYEFFGVETSLLVAFLIGIGFGFFLERAGFGSARKLTAQFYFTDLAVFKVMFTAIVTAMLGVFYLGWTGVLDLSLVYLTPTYLPAQILGGLVLGAGFVIGGYCPGTSMVAIATGKLDAIVYVLGVAAGIFFFGESFEALSGLFFAGSYGELLLSDVFDVSYGVLVLAVVLMALGGFYGAEILEKKMATKEVAPSISLTQPAGDA